jgi:hypothetical protein
MEWCINAFIKLTNIRAEDVPSAQSAILCESGAIILRPPAIHSPAGGLEFRGSRRERGSPNPSFYSPPVVHYFLAQQEKRQWIADAQPSPKQPLLGKGIGTGLSYWEAIISSRWAGKVVR